MVPRLEAVHSLGAVKRGRLYKVLGEGKDWVLVSIKGSPVYCHRWCFYGE